MTNFARLSIAAVAMVLLVTPAHARLKDDVAAMQARMLVLEKSAASASAATVRISELEDQLQDLTGQIEELSFQLDQANRRIESMSAILAGDTLTSDNPGGPVDLSTGDPIAGVLEESASDGTFFDDAQTSTISLPLNSDAAYDYSLDFLLAGDYQSAKDAFQLYLEAFPNHSRTADAQFRLGEIHLALEEYALGADAFISHIRRFPDDARAPEAYVKLGSAFASLDKGTEACTVFKTMRTKFPGAESNLLSRAGQEMTRLGCG